MSRRPTKHMLKQDAAVRVLKVLGREALAKKLYQASDAYKFAAEVVRYIGLGAETEVVLAAATSARHSSAWHAAIESVIDMLPKLREE